MENFEGKHAELSIEKCDTLCKVAHALSSPVRVQIMCALGKKSMNVGELAQALDIPMSTAALAVKTLEEAGIIMTEMQPGARGSMKLCSRKLDTINVSLVPQDVVPDNRIVLQMPIGGYSSAEGIKPTCGLASSSRYIGDMDNSASFYIPDRFQAQLIWFRQGALEYRFAHGQMRSIHIDWLELSFEACSEAPMYRDPWKSDIAVSINGRRLGVWTCPCDCGGRIGRLTPKWWSEVMTQYGFLKTWRVTREGSYLDNMKISDVTINDLCLDNSSYISVRIEVPSDAQNVGGLNLFGEQFGDHPQPLILCIGYHI